MVLPLLKIFSLGIRVFTKPLLNHLKEVQKQSLTRDHKLSEFFIKIGNQVKKSQKYFFLPNAIFHFFRILAYF